MPQSKTLITRPGQLLAPQLDYILVDGSSSMGHQWFDVHAALDSYMKVLRSQNIASHGIVAQFSSTGEYTIWRDSAIAEWDTFVNAPLRQIGGGTALYDAIAQMGWELRDLDPPRATIVIITDGDELSSTHTDETQARSILDWCRAKGWQVVFLGADFNNSRQAKALGADAHNSIGVQKKLLGDVGRMLGEKRARNALAGTDINFSDDEKQQFGGYLAAPEGSK